MEPDKKMRPDPSQKPNPLVSVVITTFNHSKVLRHALRSVLEQDYRPIEIIVADDESTDDTAEVVRAQGSGLVRHVRLPHSGYPSVTLAGGLREAKGEIIMCLEGDDQFLPGKISCQVRYLLEHPECDLLFGDIYHVEDGGAEYIVPDPARHATYFSWRVMPKKIDVNVFFPVQPIHINTVAFRPKLLEKTVPDDSFRYIWDWDFYLRLWKAGCRIHYTRDLVAVYRRNPKGLSSSNQSIQRAAVEQIRLVALYKDDLPPGYGARLMERWRYDWVKQAMKLGQIKTSADLASSEQFPSSLIHRLKAYFYLVKTRLVG